MNSMKRILVYFLAVMLPGIAFSQDSISSVARPDPNKKIQVVETACGECQFKLDGKGCHLAVKIDGKAYFVDGTSIDDHGDAHAKDGFCNAVRKAEMQGELINNRYKITYFKMLKENKETESKKSNKDKGK